MSRADSFNARVARSSGQSRPISVWFFSGCRAGRARKAAPLPSFVDDPGPLTPRLPGRNTNRTPSVGSAIASRHTRAGGYQPALCSLSRSQNQTFSSPRRFTTCRIERAWRPVVAGLQHQNLAYVPSPLPTYRNRTWFSTMPRVGRLGIDWLVGVVASA